jgi:hypothetical protein
MYSKKRAYNTAQLARVENIGVLIASGLIAGEALIGLVFAGFAVFEMFPTPIFSNPSFGVSLVFLAIIGIALIWLPLKNAGSKEEPAPPASF